MSDEPSGAVPHESLYCAEQIKIPSDLPDILKNYTKHILRAQPSDIIAASAEYFGRLAKQRIQVAGKRVTNMQLEALFSKFVSRDIVMIVRKEIEEACSIIGIPFAQVNDTLTYVRILVQSISQLYLLCLKSLGAWSVGDRVPWLKFWAFLVASASGTLVATMENVCKIVGDAGLVPIEIATEVLLALSEIDKDVDIGKITLLVTNIRQQVTGKDISVDILLDSICKATQVNQNFSDSKNGNNEMSNDEKTNAENINALDPIADMTVALSISEDPPLNTSSEQQDKNPISED
ncbi:Ropporin-1-like protein [Nowakowskiella sp. JEL0078]|nr:Ropporin-1-like protein [Nowakowskiella sp. JEL0078]